MRYPGLVPGPHPHVATNGKSTPMAAHGLVSFWDMEIDQFSCLLCWTPPSFNAECCNARSPRGHDCTREPGHEAAHAACGPALHLHPIEVWED